MIMMIRTMEKTGGAQAHIETEKSQLVKYDPLRISRRICVWKRERKRERERERQKERESNEQ